jgi:hypothetical protein
MRLSVLPEPTPIRQPENAGNVTNCHRQVTVLYQALPIVTAIECQWESSEDGDEPRTIDATGLQERSHVQFSGTPTGGLGFILSEPLRNHASACLAG